MIKREGVKYINVVSTMEVLLNKARAINKRDWPQYSAEGVDPIMLARLLYNDRQRN